MKLRFFGAMCLNVILATGCKSEEEPEDQMMAERLLLNQTIRIDGLERNYHLFVPDNPVNAPVVLLLHGHHGSHDQLLSFNGTRSPFKFWLDIAAENNIVVAVPNGTLGPQNSRGWNDCRSDSPRTPQTDDVGFIDALLDSIAAEYAVDSQRVYINGISNGGHFAMRLAEERPNKIAAIAPIVASRPVATECADSDVPMPVLLMNGTADTFVPYAGGEITANGGEAYSTDESIDYYRQRNLNDSEPEVSELPDINADDDSTVTKILYSNGNPGSEVVLYRVNNGGHVEPSIDERFRAVYLMIVGNQNGDIEMALHVWDFFENKSK